MKYIDFRSDTITQPTEEMRLAMFKAEVGDDVYGEDLTVKKLESLAADKTGKEAAIFVPSGTMGNQLAIMTHTKRGDEVLTPELSHIIQYEVGAASVLSGVTIRTVKADRGRIALTELESLIRGKNVHYPDTGLISIENATSVGTLIPIEEMKQIHELAQSRSIPVHLDGARLFNAAAALNVEASEIASYADSVMFCLSKGLCAPVGSILAGSSTFIEKVRRNRKMLGGGLRQSGFLAAAGIVALEKMVNRLAEDHENAKFLAQSLSEIDGVEIDLSLVQINMVFANITNTGKSQKQFVSELLQKGIKISETSEGSPVRFVTNNNTSRDDVEYTAKVIKEILG